MKAYYVNLAYLKLESGPNMRVTILDRSRRQRVKVKSAQKKMRLIYQLISLELDVVQYSTLLF